MRKLLIILFLLPCLSSISQTKVRGYIKSNGTYVEPHYRSSPNRTQYDNYSTKGNINPYTGKEGTKNAYESSHRGYSSAYYSVNSTVGSSYYSDSYYSENYYLSERNRKRKVFWFITFLLTTTAGICLFYKP